MLSLVLVNCFFAFFLRGGYRQGVPRRNPLSKQEAEICHRLQAARKALTIPRVAFARKAGIDSSTLERIEFCRMPARYEEVRKIGETFGLNQRWLAEGKDPRRPYIPIEPELGRRIPPRMLFSEAYMQFLQPSVEGTSEFIKEMKGLGLLVETLLRPDQFPGPARKPKAFFAAIPEDLPAIRKRVALLKSYADALLDKAKDLEEGISFSEEWHKTHPPGS